MFVLEKKFVYGVTIIFSMLHIFLHDNQNFYYVLHIFLRDNQNLHYVSHTFFYVLTRKVEIFNVVEQEFFMCIQDFFYCLTRIFNR